MAGSDQQWASLASIFPAGLDTETEPAKLKDGFTPSAYNLDIEHPGYLAKAVTAPTGTAYSPKTFTISANTWTLHYGRLWRISGANLLANAPDYTDKVFEQGIGGVPFDDDTNNVIAFMPCLGGQMFVAKAIGGYLVPNASSFDNDFQRTDIEAAMAVATAGYAVPMDGIPYVSNASGLFAWDGREVAEITKLVRSNLTPFASRTLRRDNAKRRIVGVDGSSATKFVYDAKDQKLYDYSQSGFRYTTRMLVGPEYQPFSVEKVGFRVTNTAGESSQIKYQIDTGDGYGDEYSYTFRAERGATTFEELTVNRPVSSRTFQLRITDMDSGIYIRGIDVLLDAAWNKESWA